VVEGQSTRDGEHNDGECCTHAMDEDRLLQEDGDEEEGLGPFARRHHLLFSPSPLANPLS
jgi:hypothetical protein